MVLEMLKKKLGIEAIERDKFLEIYFKIPLTLNIPEGCERIGLAAFYSCPRLEKVVIPESVVDIGVSAFEDCKNLRDVVIPGSVERIELYAFKGCDNLKEVVIPKSVEMIGYEAFCNCEITLEKPKSEFKFISPDAFKSCRDAKEKVRT